MSKRIFLVCKNAFFIASLLISCSLSILLSLSFAHFQYLTMIPLSSANLWYKWKAQEVGCLSSEEVLYTIHLPIVCIIHLTFNDHLFIGVLVFFHHSNQSVFNVLVVRMSKVSSTKKSPKKQWQSTVISLFLLIFVENWCCFASGTSFLIITWWLACALPCHEMYLPNRYGMCVWPCTLCIWGYSQGHNFY